MLISIDRKEGKEIWMKEGGKKEGKRLLKKKL
jgi:hypothetical protein